MWQTSGLPIQLELFEILVQLLEPMVYLVDYVLELLSALYYLSSLCEVYFVCWEQHSHFAKLVVFGV
jgi:hypothetical protein